MNSLAHSEEEMQSHEELFLTHWLPRKPLAGKKKNGGYYRRSREKALTMPYIETNPKYIQSLFVFDIDTTNAETLCEDLGFPLPTCVVVNNNEIGTGHIIFALKDPICRSQKGHWAPKKYADDIYKSMADLFGADKGYARRIMKNPINPPEGHYVVWNQDEEDWFNTYTLDELAQALKEHDALQHNVHKQRNSDKGFVGRNCHVFDQTRLWAYREVRQYWDKDFSSWENAVYSQVKHFNESLRDMDMTPLPVSEVRSIARSVSKWIWENVTPESYAAWLERCRENGIKNKKFAWLGGVKNKEAKLDRAHRALQLRAEGLTRKQVAKHLGVSEKTIQRYCKQEREGTLNRIKGSTDPRYAAQPQASGEQETEGEPGEEQVSLRGDTPTSSGIYPMCASRGLHADLYTPAPCMSIPSGTPVQQGGNTPTCIPSYAPASQTSALPASCMSVSLGTSVQQLGGIPSRGVESLENAGPVTRRRFFEYLNSVWADIDELRSIWRWLSKSGSMRVKVRSTKEGISLGGRMTLGKAIERRGKQLLPKKRVAQISIEELRCGVLLPFKRSIAVAFPYDADLVAEAKMLGGRWDSFERVWKFSKKNLREVLRFAHAHEFFVRPEIEALALEEGVWLAPSSGKSGVFA